MLARKNQTFSHQQNIWIVTNFGEFKSSTALIKKGIPQELKIVKTSTSQLRLLQSYQQIYGLR